MIDYNTNIDYNFNQLLDGLSEYNVPDKTINLIKDNIDNIIKEYDKKLISADDKLNDWKLAYEELEESHDDLEDNYNKLLDDYDKLEEKYNKATKLWNGKSLDDI